MPAELAAEQWKDLTESEAQYILRTLQIAPRNLSGSDCLKQRTEDAFRRKTDSLVKAGQLPRYGADLKPDPSGGHVNSTECAKLLLPLLAPHASSVERARALTGHMTILDLAAKLFNGSSGRVTPADAASPPMEPVPHFVASARPVAVPPELVSLPDDARVTFEGKMGSVLESGRLSAGDYRAWVQERVDRQAEGYFTLDEAAQVLADSQNGLDPKDAVIRFQLAHKKGDLQIRQAGSRFPLRADETTNHHCHLLKVADLDDWLRKQAGYGFPDADGDNGYHPKSSHISAPTAAVDEPGHDVDPSVKQVQKATPKNILKRRTDPLTAVLAQARGQAVDGNDWQSVWAALVALATPPTRPAPLLGYVEGEGVQYRVDSAAQPVGYLTRDALRKRLQYKAAEAVEVRTVAVRPPGDTR